MPWLFLLLAALAFMIALTTHSSVVLAISIVVALGFSVAWLMGLMAQRMGDTARSETMIIDPQELRRMREQAEARKTQSGSEGATALLLAGATATSSAHDSGHAGDASGADGGSGGGD